MKSTDKEIFRFPVLWEGWECDSIAFVMEREDGTRYVKMTNHGSPYIAQFCFVDGICVFQHFISQLI